VEALLIDEWSRGGDFVRVLDLASLAVVRERIRDLGKDRAIADEVVGRAAVVASEMGTNILRHARRGSIAVGPSERATEPGLELVAVDQGNGIADLASALDAPARSHGSLGVGVGAILRLSNEVDFDVRQGEGTRICARLFHPSRAHRPEVAIAGRPFPGERVSGDHAAYHRAADALTLIVCDGLGHGEQARIASARAVEIFSGRPTDPLEAILAEAHRELGATRGAVIALVRIREARRTVEIASAGNVETHLCLPRAVRRFGGSTVVVGARGRSLKLRLETAELSEGEVVVLSTDGISAAYPTLEDPQLLRQHPGVIAQRIVETGAQSTDDALVLVVR
jgi:anti-sigma regulatory factor (Ser/Thr protein kinase)